MATCRRQLSAQLRQGTLKHLDYDSQTKTLTWPKPEADKNAAREQAFYEQLSFCDVADVFRFVNEQCQFVLRPAWRSALSPRADAVLDPNRSRFQDSIVVIITQLACQIPFQGGEIDPVIR